LWRGHYINQDTKNIKKTKKIILIVGQCLSFAMLYCALAAGVAAQRTANYSTLYQVETLGLLKGSSAALIESGGPAHNSVTLLLLRSFQNIALLVVGAGLPPRF
jgi:hypothetical protein